MLARCAMALALVGPIGPAAAADEPTAFACTFNVGLARVYDKGQFVTEQAAPLAFGIEAIDQAAQTRFEDGARYRAPAGDARRQCRALS